MSFRMRANALSSAAADSWSGNAIKISVRPEGETVTASAIASSRA